MGVAESCAAPAKLNLTLEVLGQRPEGYHELESLVVFAGYGDSLRIEPAEKLSLRLEGPYGGAIKGSAADNLVVRAARLLAEQVGIEACVRLTLSKNLPVAAGLGGGSSDAAAALRGLVRFWNLELSAGELQRLGMELGADVPVCLYGRPAIMRGRGELLQPAPPLPPAWLVLANPGQALATAEVFQARSGPFSRPTDWWQDAPADAADLAARLAGKANDLEAPAMSLCPAIAEVLTCLRKSSGCLLARMSGSGATCFGLYGEPVAADRAAVSLAASKPRWWVRAAPLLRS